MFWNWLRRHPYLVDTGIVLALAGGYIGRAAHLGQFAGGVPIAVLEVAPLLVRRRYPRLVFAAVTAAWLADSVLYSPLPPVPVAVAVYTLATTLGRQEAVVAGATAVVVTSVTSLADREWNLSILSVLLLGAGWVLGDSLGTRRAYVQALEERAERLEREQAAERARAVAEEQARIGRELHDVIAHNVSVMVVQAAAANDVFEARPERAREALHAIEATGRSALTELRRLLGSVRGDGTDFMPQPGLDRLDELVAQVRAAGLAVAVSVDGARRELPAGIDLSA